MSHSRKNDCTKLAGSLPCSVIGRVVGRVIDVFADGARVAVCGALGGLVCSTVAMAGPDPVVWNNGPAAGGGAIASQSSSAADAAFNAQSADDLMFTEATTITGVQWTGVYFGPMPVVPVPNPGPAFNIRIYPDGGAGTAPTGGPGDPSALALATFDTGVGGAAQAGPTAGVFSYAYVLSPPFEAAAGVKYWLSIQAVVDFPPQWGWSISTTDQLAEARLGSNGDFVLTYWSDPLPPTVDDLAFTLTGTVQPQTGACCTVRGCIITTAENCQNQAGFFYGVGTECQDCEDGDPCTADICDPGTGKCLHVPLDCNDGDPCTTDTCVDGKCVHTPVDCDDGDLCTTDSCDPRTGNCVHTPVDCDDGDPCTTDSCDPRTGECVHTPVDCDDGDPCTTDTCDPRTGKCVHTPIDCDDFDPTTIDTCDPRTGKCIHTPAECDDGDPCTVDTRDRGTGKCVHTPVDCDDGDPCTTDSCDPIRGECIHTPVDCNDGLACTIDTCEPITGLCVHTPANLCIGNADGDDDVDVDDLLEVIYNWGACLPTPAPCAADFDCNGAVDVDDLIAVIVHWNIQC